VGKNKEQREADQGELRFSTWGEAVPNLNRSLPIVVLWYRRQVLPDNYCPKTPFVDLEEFFA
jgi:hypothetical protein